MQSGDDLPQTIMGILRERLGDTTDAYTFPPPCFTSMQGEFVDLDLDQGWLKARFPVRRSHLNPYDTMQGGMIAAAVDNTLGPLSVLVAPPNLTRRLEMTYSHPVTLPLGHVIVTARLMERSGRWLTFRAEVHDADRRRLVRAKATHWILDEADLEALKRSSRQDYAPSARSEMDDAARTTTPARED